MTSILGFFLFLSRPMPLLAFPRSETTIQNIKSPPATRVAFSDKSGILGQSIWMSEMFVFD
jgi:hypothetical protein